MLSMPEPKPSPPLPRLVSPLLGMAQTQLQGWASGVRRSLQGFVSFSLSDAYARRFVFIIVLNVGLLLPMEVAMWVYYAYFSPASTYAAASSTSVIASATHMTLDCSGIVLALHCMYMASWAKNKDFTYGYGRYELLSCFSNGLTLLLFSLFSLFTKGLRLLSNLPYLLSWSRSPPLDPALDDTLHTNMKYQNAGVSLLLISASVLANIIALYLLHDPRYQREVVNNLRRLWSGVRGMCREYVYRRVVMRMVHKYRLYSGASRIHKDEDVEEPLVEHVVEEASGHSLLRTMSHAFDNSAILSRETLIDNDIHLDIDQDAEGSSMEGEDDSLPSPVPPQRLSFFSATGMNTYSIYLHSVTDIINGTLSLLLVSATSLSLIGWETKERVLSPLLICVTSIMMISLALPLVIQSGSLLLLMVPASVRTNLNTAVTRIMQLPKVVEVREPKVWVHASDMIVGSIRVHVEPDVEDTQVLLRQAHNICAELRINMMTIEVVS